MTSVVLPEALDRELADDGLKGLVGGRPMLTVAEPEFVFGAVALAKRQVIGVQLFPAFGAGWNRDICCARKLLHLSRGI